MRQDEYNTIIDPLMALSYNLNPKRSLYLIKKWIKKGWIRKPSCATECVYPAFTDEFKRIQELVKNKDKYLEELEGQVITIYFIDGNPMMGILEEDSDGDLYFYTQKSSWYIIKEDIAYIEKHPDPKNLWRRLNYFYWKFHNIENRFHKTIHFMGHGWTSEFKDGQYTRTNEFGEEGECYPDCPCKTIYKKQI